MKQQTMKTALLVLGVLLGLAACKKDPVEDPNVLPPQQQLPNPLSAWALLKKFQLTNTDYQSFTYNPQGQVSKLHAQWQYVEGDPNIIKAIDYNFQYDSQNRPVQLDLTGGPTVRYLYRGNLIDKTRELFPDGSIATEVQYIYANNRVAAEVWYTYEAPGKPLPLIKYVFAYDAKGNLNQVETFQQDSSLVYRLTETVSYTDFDDKVNPNSWMLRYPYLPQMRYQFNNPRKEVRLQVGGQPQTITRTYEYNAQGLPVSKRASGPFGELPAVTYAY